MTREDFDKEVERFAEKLKKRSQTITEFQRTSNKRSVALCCIERR